MSIDLDTHRAPRPQPKPKPELPPIVRDYLEHVRGAPEMFERILPDYLDRLWVQALDFAMKNAAPCPVHLEEIDALRAVVENRMISETLAQAEESAPPCETRTPGRSFKKTCDLRRHKAPQKKRRLSALPILRRIDAGDSRLRHAGLAKDRAITSPRNKGKRSVVLAHCGEESRLPTAARARRAPLRIMKSCVAPSQRIGRPSR